MLTPVTTPLSLTLAIDGALELQTFATPSRSIPAAGVIASVMLAPSVTSESAVGVIEKTRATSAAVIGFGVPLILSKSQVANRRTLATEAMAGATRCVTRRKERM